MSLAMLPPLFAPASQFPNAPQSGGPNVFGNDANVGDLDFDMLAEYLLDDETAAEGGGILGLAAFDFK